MKRFILSLLIMVAALQSSAQDMFRSHRYDVFKVLPVNNENIVFIGNSITNMHEWWEAFGSNHNIINRGVWGTFINETVDNIEAIAIGKPRKVFIMVGTNDLGKNGNRNINNIIASTRTIVERFKGVSPNTEIYIQSILPSVYNRELSQLEETNRRLKVLCDEEEITYIDLWDDLYSLTFDYTHTLDGLHLKASGYRIWTKKIEQYIGCSSVYPDDCTERQSTNGISNASYGMRATIFSTLPVNDGDILIIGDEMIHGGEWHELLQSSKVKSRGSGWGYASPGIDVIQKEIPLILNNNQSPSKVLLYAGAAELNGNATLDNIETAYKSIIEKIKELAPNTEILLMSLLPTGNSNTNTERIVPFNKKLQKIAEEDTQIEFIDIYSSLANGNIADSKYISNNYLMGMGYVKVAQKIAEAIEDSSIVAITDEEAENNYITFQLRSTLGNAIATATVLKEGNGVGEYTAEILAELQRITDEAYTLLQTGGTKEEFQAMGERINTAINSVLSNINMPLSSKDKNEFWYKMYTPNRNSRYLSSNGDGNAATGKEDNNRADTQWKFVERSDGTLNIINRADGTYLNPSSAHNTSITTTSAEPARGWELSYSNTPGLFIINSGTTQLNQTQSHLDWKIYNWSTNADGQDRNDTGCQYKIELVTEEPDEIIPENILHFSFSRGTSLTNSFVTITDETGCNTGGVTASITAGGAPEWLTSNKAAADSILCLNINTNATTADTPITYTLSIDGIDNNFSINSITFSSVALNYAGNWQGATETRHCNFECSYGNDNSLETLTPIKDESIMIASGALKDITFETEGIMPVDGRLNIKLNIYKGTNNLGCFYGLTGITLRGVSSKMPETGITTIVIAPNETKIYDLSGRECTTPKNGIYIINGKKYLK
ncbi:MAG: hypothetical protein E7088_05370 [Bacteroidales bacterium]|nr:hypothetical protein [Bacteroidales bacterium]